MPDSSPEEQFPGAAEGVVKSAETTHLPEWQQAEVQVRSAESLKRQSGLASNLLYRETGLLKANRQKLDEETILGSSQRKRVVKRALESERVYNEQVDNILGREDSPERALIALQRKELKVALKAARTLESQRRNSQQEEVEILRGVESQPDEYEQEALEAVRGDLRAFDQSEQALLESSPEAFYGIHLKQLKKYKTELQLGRLVETPYVKAIIEEILARFWAGKPILIYGHLGAGKTELAMHIARKYIGAEALVISGSKHTSLAELYGHQVLTIDKAHVAESEEVERRYDAWIAQHPEAAEGEKNRAHDRILQTYLTDFKSGTISDYFLGPIYRAMEEGQPVIIDEVNAIPHEVLISLNHILTRKLGETVCVQQNSGKTIQIKKGFGIIMTGNLDQGESKYVDRQDMDPAFLSRLFKVEYDYLPQSTEGSLTAEAGKENELFLLMLAKMMDDHGNTAVPQDSFRKLWNLAKAARLSQNVFAGKEVSSAFYFQEAGGRPIKYLLKESVLSIRAIDSVLTQWQRDGFKYELDYYIWKEFIFQSTQAADRAYLYQMFKDRFGFFASPGWSQTPNYGSGGQVSNFDIPYPRNPADQRRFFGPRDVVEAAFGQPPPRAKWPDILDKNQSDPDSREEPPIDPDMVDLQRFLDAVDTEYMPEVEAAYLEHLMEEGRTEEAAKEMIRQIKEQRRQAAAVT